jgi:hypothetical protein
MGFICVLLIVPPSPGLKAKPRPDEHGCGLRIAGAAAPATA